MSQDSIASMATLSFPPANTDRIFNNLMEAKQDDFDKEINYLDTEAGQACIVRKEYIK